MKKTVAKKAAPKKAAPKKAAPKRSAPKRGDVIQTGGTREKYGRLGPLSWALEAVDLLRQLPK